MKNYRETWDVPVTEQVWDRFLQHDFTNPTRSIAARTISGYAKRNDAYTLLEVGFGQCYDFKHYFLPMLKRGSLDHYYGCDITKQFVDFAHDRYRDVARCAFEQKGFLDLPKLYADIVYTRHTLEHQDELLWEKCLCGLLDAARRLCVITWFIAPGNEENLQWLPNQWHGQGAWVNRYKKDDVLEIIGQAGFQMMTIVHSTDLDKIYVCERRTR